MWQFAEHISRVQADCCIRSESLRIGSGFPIVFLQYTFLVIYNHIENGHIFILPG